MEGVIPATTLAAIRSCKFGLKMTNSNKGMNQAMYNPPPYPCQNCAATINAAEELINVPRFLRAGQMVKNVAKIANPTITGKRQIDSSPRPTILAIPVDPDWV